MIVRLGFYLLFFLALPALVYPKPQHHASPTPSVPTPSADTAPSRHDLFLTVDHIVQLSQDLQNNLNSEKVAHQMTESELARAYSENAALQKQIDKETLDFNSLKDKYASATKKLWWYRVHFFLGWVLFITGILAGATIWILKITGKLGIIAAKI